jgi:hypothetical protein
MILPTKHLSEDRALLTVGGQLLGLLEKPKTVSVLWEDFKARPDAGVPVPFDWFVLEPFRCKATALAKNNSDSPHYQRPAFL